ncbi:MAG: hypothetical protein WA708_06210 [Acidobacteriaceae bacterium]
MTLFENIVTLRGFLGKDAEVPSSDHIQPDSFAVLLLGTMSGTWDVATNAWTPRIEWHRIICPGPYFCGFTRGMRRGDYLEVEGELRALEQDRTVVVVGERYPGMHATYAVHAIHINRLERPLVVVDTGDGD